MKSILGCISKLTLKLRVKIPIVFKMEKSNYIVKIKNKIHSKSILENKFNSYSKSTLFFKIKNKDVKSILKFFIKFDDSSRHLKNYNIKDEFIINNIKSLERITSIHITNYCNKFLKYIPNSKDVVYITLGNHQYNIKSLEDYRKRKPEEVITKEVLNRIKYL